MKTEASRLNNTSSITLREIGNTVNEEEHFVCDAGFEIDIEELEGLAGGQAVDLLQDALAHGGRAFLHSAQRADPRDGSNRQRKVDHARCYD